MRRLFAGLAEDKHLRELDAIAFATKAAHVLAELNAIHPFREGNGRTQLSFLVVLAHQAGHALDQRRLDPEAMLGAMINSFGGREGPLADLILHMAHGGRHAWRPLKFS
jgi:cell filamentation protein